MFSSLWIGWKYDPLARIERVNLWIIGFFVLVFFVAIGFTTSLISITISVLCWIPVAVILLANRKLRKVSLEYDETFVHDLQYVGFVDFLNGSKPHYYTKGLGWIAATPEEYFVSRPNEKPSDRIEAFFRYGYVSFFIKKGHQIVFAGEKEDFIIYDDDDRDEWEGWSGRSLVESLLTRTIRVSRRTSWRRWGKSSLNPIPYAAYLFRVASFNNNPSNRIIQKKALFLWKTNRSLAATLMLAEVSLEEIKLYKDAPDSWVEEIVST